MLNLKVFNPINKHNYLYKQYCKIIETFDYKKCYKVLEIAENSDQEQIRAAFIRLAKLYHPDSGTEYADVNKFHEVDTAFKILVKKKSKERWDVEDENVINEVETYDIKHTAPQHRQYLSYGGIGYGTPFERQKQYSTVRAMQAAQNVLQHRVAKVTADEKSLMVKNPIKHKVNTRYGFDRLVEDLIQEAMSKGEFNNLAGTGKPLQQQQGSNPYVDFTTHKINQVLIDNGFTPEWITLQKEIREDVKVLRESLLVERSYFGPNPLKDEEIRNWDKVLKKHEILTGNINIKINKYNLVVPILDKQMFLIDLDQESSKALNEGKCNLQVDRLQREKEEIVLEDTNNVNIFGFINYLFSGKV